MNTIDSKIPEIVWPPLTDNLGATLLATLYQIEQNQWHSAARIERDQFRQLNSVFHHARRTIPYYKKKYQAVSLKSMGDVTPETWLQIPLLSRSELQSNYDTLLSREIPKEHGDILTIQSTGSTGKPVKVDRTHLTSFFYELFTLRDHLWHGRDFAQKLAIIRHAPQGKNSPPGESTNAWSKVIEMIYKENGTSSVINSNTPIPQQIKWLIAMDPRYLLTYPSNLRELASVITAGNHEIPNLAEVVTFGEVLDRKDKERCSDLLGVKVTDMYSCQEAGYLALECPTSTCYHVQSENVLVEILDTEGLPVQPGSIGKVVITTLNNFAMPLIRYDIGDYAEVGGVCSCGRGLPSLKKIIGRVRNMLTLPNGQKIWPDLGSSKFREMGIQQFQVIQQTHKEIEMKLVLEEGLQAVNEELMLQQLRHSLGYDFNITFTYQKEIPRSSGGKYEDFMSKVS